MSLLGSADCRAGGNPVLEGNRWCWPPRPFFRSGVDAGAHAPQTLLRIRNPRDFSLPHIVMMIKTAFSFALLVYWKEKKSVDLFCGAKKDRLRWLKYCGLGTLDAIQYSCVLEQVSSKSFSWKKILFFSISLPLYLLLVIVQTNSEHRPIDLVVLQRREHVVDDLDQSALTCELMKTVALTIRTGTYWSLEKIRFFIGPCNYVPQKIKGSVVHMNRLRIRLSLSPKWHIFFWVSNREKRNRKRKKPQLVNAKDEFSANPHRQKPS